MVLAVPEVGMHRLTAAAEFLILACDGIWETLSDQQVGRYRGSGLSASGTGY